MPYAVQSTPNGLLNTPKNNKNPQILPTQLITKMVNRAHFPKNPRKYIWVKTEQKQNKKYAKLLVEEFEQLMVEERHGSKIQIMNLIIYAAYSGVFVDNQKILGIFLEVLEGKVGGLGMVGVDLALDCAGLYLEDRDIHIDAQPLWTILVNCKDNPNRR